MPIAGVHSKSSGSSKPPSHSSGIRLEWIDEQERKRDPKSHLRTIVRSIAKRNYHLNLNAAKAKAKAKPLRKLGKAAHPTITPERNRVSEQGSSTGNTGYTLPTDVYQVSNGHYPFTQLVESGKRFSIQSSQRRSTPQLILGAGVIDPFDSFPVKMTPHLHKIIHHYTSYMCHLLPRRDDGQNLINTQWVPMFMVNIMGFKSLLVAAETSLRGNSGLNPWSLLTMEFMIEIMGLLRKEISCSNPNVSDTMIATLVNIAGVELTWGNRGEYENHMMVLREMVRIRRRQKKELSSFLGGMVNWMQQLGGRMVTSNVDELDTSSTSTSTSTSITPCQAQKGSVENSPTSPAHLPISNDLLEILKSIQSLTVVHKPLDISFKEGITSDFRKTCRGIQRQLRSLSPKAITISKLERLCNLAARSYIDIILLHSPGRINDVTQELHQALTEVHNSEEEKENDDIIKWVFGMVAAELAIGSQNSNNKAILVDELNEIIFRLEGLSMQGCQ